MNRATIRRIERRLLPQPDGITRSIVAMLETPEGLLCDACGKVHATEADAERAHGGPGVLLLVERIVEA